MIETTRYRTSTSGTDVVVEFEHYDDGSDRSIFLSSCVDDDGHPDGQYLTVAEAEEVRRDLARAIRQAKERK